MVKNFLIVCIVFLILYVVYIYRGYGNREHREKVVIIGIFGILYMCLFLFFMVMKPEIKAFFAQLKSVENVSAGTKKSVGIDRIIYASPERSCTCVVNAEDIDKAVAVANERNELLYELLVEAGTLIVIREDTLVRCYYGEEYQGFVPVIFYDGEFKGKRAYVLGSVHTIELKKINE